MNHSINENWECFLCGRETSFDELPTGYLANYHPLCNSCADNVLKDEKNNNRYRLTFHKNIGDIKMIANIPVDSSHPRQN